MNNDTRGGFKRAISDTDNKNIHRAILNVQQEVLNHVYSLSDVLSNCSSLDGRFWKTSK